MARYSIPGPALESARQIARRVRSLEAEARSALLDHGDTDGHRARLTEKCRLLAALPETVARLLPSAATDDTAAFAAGLEDIAERAGMALSLESIFFMGALLYPEDYRDGERNDLERFLEEFDPV